mmetsp:Transcript_294/g.478  ORF Transcript_294/g.478 Transcript_294/m.478 type:complete len:346 (+) Transcript_294:104-1141(+)
MEPFVKTVDDESTIDDVKSQFAGDGLTLILAVASFDKKCKPLLDEIESSLEEDCKSSGGCCGGIAVKNTLVLKTDESDELEEIAIDLGLNNIPSFQIYTNGKLVSESGDDDAVTYSVIKAALDKASSSASSSSCCPTDQTPACCPDQTACCPEPTDQNDILKLVSTSYANTVNKTQSCCVSVDSTLNGYSAEDLLKAGTDANLGLGCGNPLSFANLKDGETVVDLGSGAGIDCFIASDKVGPSGKVIGIDMTPDMIHTARKNAKKKKINNVQFRLGEIEYLPVADNSVDCVISNCVINLSPDKPQVFKDIYRILIDGGRIAISDVVTRPEKIIPEELKTAEALAC